MKNFDIVLSKVLLSFFGFLLSTNKILYNIRSHNLIINQSHDFSPTFAKCFIFAKTLWLNLLIHSYRPFLINIINPINLFSDISSDLTFSIRMNLIYSNLSVGIQFYAPICPQCFEDFQTSLQLRDGLFIKQVRFQL